MAESALTQLLMLLGTTVSAVLLFQRLRIPSSLAYLTVGVALGSNTAGPGRSPVHSWALSWTLESSRRPALLVNRCFALTAVTRVYWKTLALRAQTCSS